MKYLIFEPEYGGHRLEYMHHIYMYAGNVMSQDEFIFVFHPKIKDKLGLLKWQSYDNIKILYLDIMNAIKIESGGLLKQAYQKCKVLKKYFIDYKPDKIIVDTLVLYMPFLPFFFRKRNLIRGIIYKIPKFISNCSFKKKLEDKLFLSIIALSKSIETVWLLNDTDSVTYYNTKYNISKYKWLPDPINIQKLDIEEESSINSKCKGRLIFLHPGGMGNRKGTFEILEAIKLMNSEDREKCFFIFAGVISNREEREKMLSFQKAFEKDKFMLFTDRFISFEELASFYRMSDYVLIPYQNVQQSSGVLGSSAYYHKPVIGPKEGLLGNLISTYKLGYTIDNITAEKLKNQILELIRNKLPVIDYEFDNYISVSTPDNFAMTILER